MHKKKVVVIGGGTGTYTLLSGLKRYADSLDITAVVTMADSGGSTGRLRDEFGYLPVGDVRMALSALAADVEEHDNLLRELFLYRFSRGQGLEGHNFGNLLLTTLTDMLGSEVQAIETASRLLRVAGKVVPVTTDNAHLVARFDTGEEVVGEHAIDEPPPERHYARLTHLSLTPPVTLYTGAAAAIKDADLVVLGPGDLYTSILANCVVDGMAAALQSTPARLLYVANLMARRGQTIGMALGDYVTEITRYVGRRPDVVVAHGGTLRPELLARYAASEQVHPVEIGQYADCPVHLVDIVSEIAVEQKAGDVVPRSLIRHDSDRLAAAIVTQLPAMTSTSDSE